MNRRFVPLIAALVLVSLLVSACSALSPGGPADTGDSQATIEAAVRETATQVAMVTEIARLEAELTEAAQPPAPPTVTIAPTDTPAPTDTGAPTPTLTLTPTVTQTLTPTVTLTSTPTLTTTPATPTITALPCNSIKFEADVSIPDGTVLSPGSTFTKTWRLRNTGACTWTTSYDLVFVDGDRMDAPLAVDLPANVAAGEVIDLSVTMIAPSSEGHYRGNWKLRDASGILFGLGKTNASFYVDIRVVNPATTTGSLDMVSRMCSAEWSNASTTLPCPGARDDSRGFVLRIDNPTLESGYIDDEPVLLTHPQFITDGVIRGKYPPFRVENGHHFSAVIGCAYQATSCDVTFRLDYQIENSSVQVLKSWQEKYDGKFVSVDVDLSSLAGKDVKFILTVLTNGPSTQDQAQWLAPRIRK